jgi:5-methylcytosine-specific restriction endonuclease McrA
MKECSKCKQIKNFDAFSKRKGCKGGLDAQCKECKKAYYSEYYLKNSKKIIETARVWVSQNQKKRKKYYQENKERILKKQRKWRQENPEKFSVARKRAKIKRENTLKECKSKRKSTKKHKQYLKEIGLYDGKNFFCYVSGKKLTSKNLSFDHVIPISRGGKDVEENILPMDLKLNLSKGNKFLKDWLETL